MSALLMFNGVYRLEIQSVMLLFSIQLCELWPTIAPLTFSLVHLPPIVVFGIGNELHQYPDSDPNTAASYFSVLGGSRISVER